ncbi:MAG TPA: hypothetical protein PKC18_20645, partial [Lacipirellulaceae bacterium]|nr:hypothetical protein [Lacipirellulaceae bacterium]
MHEARGCWRVALSVGLWLAAGCSGPNAPVEAPAEETALDGSRQQAIEIAERMLARYREAQSYSDSAAYVEESVLRGEGVARELPYYQMTLAFVRPNRVRLSLSEALADADGRRQGFDAACDGRWMRATLLE